MTCEGCGRDGVRHVKIRFVIRPEDKHLKPSDQRSDKLETCEVCSALSNTIPMWRDAAGQRIIFTGPVGINDATGTAINSAKDISEYCRRNNRAQTGGSDER